MNALNVTAERIILAKTMPKPRTFQIQVEAAEPNGPLKMLGVCVKATDAESAEREARRVIREAGYAMHRVARVIATSARGA